MNVKKLENDVRNSLLKKAEDDFKLTVIEQLISSGEDNHIAHLLKEFEKNKDLASYFFMAGWDYREAFSQAEELLK